MNDHEDYAEWDAAYVLGALSAAQRREFEDHLAGCERCARAVGDVAALPGLLSKLDPGEAFAMLDADAAGAPAVATDRAPAGILSGLITRVRHRRRRHIWAFSVTGFAAAAAIVAALMLPIAANAPVAPTLTMSLRQAVVTPISADVQFTGAGWGTRIELTCRYAAAPLRSSSEEYPSRQRYALYIIDRGGATVRVSSWNAGPGDTVQAVGSIDAALSSIARVEVRSMDSGDVLLSRAVGPSVSG